MSDPAFLGRGWTFPPSFAAGGSEVEMVSGVADIEQSLQILFGTRLGERVMQETFGCDLLSLKFEPLDQRLVNTLERLITDAVTEHEPRIKVDRVDVTPRVAGPSGIFITVRYTVSS